MKAIFLMLCLALIPEGWLRSALLLSGVSSEEELSSGEMERYESLVSNPLNLNSSSRLRLESSNLLSRYQISVLLDERSRGGDICSYAELSSLDGFTPEFAEALRPFTTLGTPVPASPSKSSKFDASGFARCSFNKDKFSPAGKAVASYREIVRASVSFSGGSLTGYSLSCSPARTSFSLILGDFYARFGQGLVLWTGFSMSGVSSPESIKRTSHGITSCNSFSSDSHLRGIALSFAPGRWTFSAICGFPGVLGANSSFSSRRSTFGLTLLASSSTLCSSLDFLSTIGKFTFFGEAAIDLRSRTFAAIAGSCWNIGYRNSLSLAVRHYPYGYDSEYSSPLSGFSSSRGESGLSAGWRYKSLSTVLDISLNRQKEKASLKPSLIWSPGFNVRGFEVSPYLKTVLRYRPQDNCPVRMELRAETSIAYLGFSVRLRADLVSCSGIGWHSYAEAGYKGPFSIFMRASVFKVDDWDDRIYVYERDVPGSFNVPARYGRGYSLSAFASYRGFSFRFGTVQYPWTPGKEPGVEFRLQWNFDSQKVRRRPRPRAGA